MAQKMITGYTPSGMAAHITADNDAQMHRGMFDISGILASDNILACTAIDGNTVRLSSGMYSNQGYLVCVPSGQTEDLPLISGTQGAWRKDLVIADFLRGGGDVSDAHIFTIAKGEDASSQAAAADPALEQDDLPTGGTHRQEALYRVTMYGVLVYQVERLCNVISPYGQMPIVKLPNTSGAIALGTNRIYQMALSGATAFAFPTPVTGLQNQIMLYLSFSGTPSVSWPSGTHFVYSLAPTFRTGKYYRVIIEYDPNAGAWCVGSIEGGTS